MTIKMPFAKPADAEKKAAAFIAQAGAATIATPRGDASSKTTINMRVDAALLARIDAAAKRQGVSRTAWMCIAVAEKLER